MRIYSSSYLVNSSSASSITCSVEMLSFRICSVKFSPLVVVARSQNADAASFESSFLFFWVGFSCVGNSLWAFRSKISGPADFSPSLKRQLHTLECWLGSLSALLKRQTVKNCETFLHATQKICRFSWKHLGFIACMLTFLIHISEIFRDSRGFRVHEWTSRILQCQMKY